VKELCKLTGKLELRISEMEAMNSRLVRVASTKSAATSTTSARYLLHRGPITNAALYFSNY